jgi:hypothetical protein
VRSVEIKSADVLRPGGVELVEHVFREREGP